MIVSNPKDHAVVLKSHDGDSVHVPAKAIRAKIADKFGWHVPRFVRVHPPKPGDPVETIDPTTIVPSKAIPQPLIRPPQTIEEALRIRSKHGEQRNRYVKS